MQHCRCGAPGIAQQGNEDAQRQIWTRQFQRRNSCSGLEALPLLGGFPGFLALSHQDTLVLILLVLTTPKTITSQNTPGQDWLERFQHLPQGATIILL